MVSRLLYSGVVDDEVGDRGIVILVVALAVEAREQTERSLFCSAESPADKHIADGASVAVKLSGEEVSVGGI